MLKVHKFSPSFNSSGDTVGDLQHNCELHRGDGESDRLSQTQVDSLLFGRDPSPTQVRLFSSEPHNLVSLHSRDPPNRGRLLSPEDDWLALCKASKRAKLRKVRVKRTPCSKAAVLKTADRPCSVYLLVHAHDQRFKIGLSMDPWTRAQNLPEAAFINWEKSLQVVLGSQSRASEVERMLHKGLAGFRLHFKPLHQTLWDGSTEWFSQSAFCHAVNLLKVTPTGGPQSELSELLPVHRQSVDRNQGSGATASVFEDSGVTTNVICVPTQSSHYVRPCVPALEKKLVPPSALQRWDQAAQHNLKKIAEITEAISVLAWNFKVVLAPIQQGPPFVPAMVCVHGLRKDLSQEAYRARCKITCSDLWAFHSTSRMESRRIIPLVKLMRYPDATPDVLTLELNDLKLIKALPAGNQILLKWLGLWDALVLKD